MQTSFFRFSSKITLTHLICVYIGVLIPITLDVYFFQKITPTTVSASTSAVTLLLALIALTKVNKWLTEKMSAKAFEKTEDFINFLTSIRKNSTRLSAVTASYVKTIPTQDDSHKVKVEGLKQIYKDMYEAGLDLILISESLKLWKVRFLVKDSFNKYLKRYIKYQLLAFKLIRILEISDLEERKQAWDKYYRDALIAWDSFRYIQDGICRVSYEQLFKHNTNNN